MRHADHGPVRTWLSLHKLSTLWMAIMDPNCQSKQHTETRSQGWGKYKTSSLVISNDYSFVLAFSRLPFLSGAGGKVTNGPVCSDFTFRCEKRSIFINRYEKPSPFQRMSCIIMPVLLSFILLLMLSMHNTIPLNGDFPEIEGKNRVYLLP